MADKNFLIKQLQREGISHPDVLQAIQKIPREQFVLPEYATQAYDNHALPIHCEQTISQPYIVALMTQALLRHHRPTKILEIGTGSGYQAAILAYLFESVWTIERIEPLYLSAMKTLKKLHFDNIAFKYGDGNEGWSEHAPYDAIIVTAATESIPEALLAQLTPHAGVMVIPLGKKNTGQVLTLIQKNGDTIEKEILEYVRFVPLLPGKT